MAELDEAIEAAALAMYGTPRLAERNRDMAERAVRAAAEVIVAATRREIAEELRAEGERLNGADWQIHGIGYAHAARWLTDRAAAVAAGRPDPAAIARGRGETGGGQ